MPTNVSWVNDANEYITLANETNKVDGTYFYYVDMTGYRKVGFQLQNISPGSGHITITCEGTVQADVPRESCAYQDITFNTFGVASGISDDIWIDNTEKLSCYKYVRLKVVANSGDDTCDYKLYSNQIY